jgi:flavin-dependent dehydrogenase
LENLGVVEQLKKNFVRKPGVRFIDRDGNLSTTWCFEHVIKNETYLSFQVIRGDFDQILLKNAAKNGAEVREETSVVEADTTSASDSVTVTSLDSTGQKTSIARDSSWTRAARCFIGAKTAGASRARSLTDFDLVALGRRQTSRRTRRRTLDHHLHGLGTEGLDLGISARESRITAGFVAQNSYIRDEQRKLKQSGSPDWKYDLCMQELLRSKFCRELLEGSSMLLPMMINGNYSYEVKNHYGSNYAMVGDARGFIDPIFSSGVFLSIKSSHLVAAALHKQLTEGLNGENEMMVTAYKQITGAYNFVHRMIRLFYNPHAVTWAQAGADGLAHKAHESAMAAGHYMLSGDFFENYEKFQGFFEILEDPKQFKRYKRLIIDRDEFNQPTCHSSWDDVFRDMVERDAKRNAELAHAST